MAACSALSLAAALNFVASLDTEVSAGVVPIRAGADGEPALTHVATPLVGVVEPTPRGNRLTLSYTPRTFWRYPNELGLQRPAILHLLNLEYQPVLTETTRFSVAGQANAGESDYTSVAEVFGDSQTVAPEDPFIRVAGGYLTLSLNQILNPRWVLRLSAPASYQVTRTTGAGASVQETLSAGLEGGASYAYTRRTRYGFSAGSTFARFDASDQLAARATATWEHQATREIGLTANAGVGRVEVLRVRIVDPERGQREPEPFYFGIAGFGVSRERQTGVDSFQLLMDGRVDPIAQTTTPQAAVTLSSTQELAERSTLMAGLFGATSVSRRATSEDFSETGVSASVSVSHRFDPVTLSWGVRAGLRAPHLSEPFEAREQQLVAFVALHWAIADPSTP